MKLIVLVGILAVVCGTPAPYRDPMINEGLYEGDIMGRDLDSDRSAVLRDEQRWPGGIVPYIIDSGEIEELKDLILRGMRYIESYTCIRFVERTTEKDYIKIKKEKGCWSLWGRSGRGEQPLSLGSGCGYFATVVHELMHALGIEHEHNRPDRDDYLTIHWDNIVEEWKYAFKKLRPEETRVLTQFDMSSIMLYGSTAFAKDYSKPSMTFRDGRKIDDIYHRESISVLDVEKMNILYQCPKARFTAARLRYGHGEFWMPQPHRKNPAFTAKRYIYGR